MTDTEQTLKQNLYILDQMKLLKHFVDFKIHSVIKFEKEEDELLKGGEVGLSGDNKPSIRDLLITVRLFTDLRLHIVSHQR